MTDWSGEIKRNWFDSETTGLDPVKNDIIQIAGVIEIDGEIIEEYEFKCRPHDPESYSQKALDVHGFTIEEMKEWPEPLDVYSKLQFMMGQYVDKYNPKDKYIPAGHNVGFDIDMFMQFSKKCGDKYLGSFIQRKALDTLVFATICRSEGLLKDVENDKLATLAKHFGIEIKAHDALSDIQANVQVYYELKKLIGNQAKIDELLLKVQGLETRNRDLLNQM